ncbi:MAG TPA: hypothetical protein VD886_20585 [Herpetosiphonaceae bacterium]|nr:hypothetical protein [Herpetosiphonaceae bacterium]
MSYGYQQPYQPYQPAPVKRRRGCLFGCLVALTVLVFAALALVLAVAFYFKPMISQEFGEALGGQLNQQLEQKINEQAGGGEIPADFSGQVVILESEVNDYLSANPQELAPLDSASVQFMSGEMRATISAYGAGGTAYAGIAVADGQVVVVNPRIEGPLGFLIDANQLAQALQSRLNSQLTANGQRIGAIEVQPGQIVATVEGAR